MVCGILNSNWHMVNEPSNCFFLLSVDLVDSLTLVMGYKVFDKHMEIFGRFTTFFRVEMNHSTLNGWFSSAVGHGGSVLAL